MAELTDATRTEVIKNALYISVVRAASSHANRVVARTPTGEELTLDAAELALKSKGLSVAELGLLAEAPRDKCEFGGGRPN
jgi:hypothetical protein